MAQKVITKTFDDIDGTEIDGGGKTLTFSLDGAQYEIDLSAQNAKRLADALDPFISAARKTGGSARRGRTSGGAATDKSQLANIREWAKSAGLKVSERGRISQQVQEAYQAAH